MATTNHDDQDILILDDNLIPTRKSGIEGDQGIEQNNTPPVDDNIIHFDEKEFTQYSEEGKNAIHSPNIPELPREKNDGGFNFSHLGKSSQADEIILDGSKDEPTIDDSMDSSEVSHIAFGADSSDNNTIRDDCNLDDAITSFVSQLGNMKQKNDENVSKKESQMKGLEEKIKNLRSEISELKSQMKSLRYDNEKIDSKIGLLTGEKTIKKVA